MNNKLDIRWMIRRDLDEVLAIESASFGNPWTEDEFVGRLRNRNVIGMVAECRDRVVGYMVYELMRTKLDVENFAVLPESRRLGVGRNMVAYMIGKLSPIRRTLLTVLVADRNLTGQLFFSACGLKAVNVIRNYFDDTAGEPPGDAILFQYRIKSESKECAGR